MLKENFPEARTDGLSVMLIEKLEEAKAGYTAKLSPLLPKTIEDKEKPKNADANKTLSQNKGKCLPDNWLSNLFSIEWINFKALLIDAMNKISVKAKELIDEIMFNFTGNNFITLLIIGLIEICESIVNQIIAPFDPVFVEISHKYNYIVSEYRKYKSFRTNPEEPSEEYRAEVKDKIINYVKDLGEDLIAAIMIYLSIDSFLELFNSIKNLWNSGEDIWNLTVNRFRDLYMLMDDPRIPASKKGILKTFKILLGTLIPIIAALGATVVCAKKCDQKIKDLAKQATDENLAGNGLTGDFDPEEEILKPYKDLSLLIEYAMKDLNGYSMYYNDENELVDEKDATSSQMVSICYVPIKRMDQTEPNERRYVLEFGKDMVGAYFNVKVGQKIAYGQTIGYWKNTKVVSKVYGIVTDKRLNHIVVVDTSTPEEIQKEVESYKNNLDMTDKFTPIIDRFKKHAYAETYVRDYALYCNYPELALHSKGGGTYMLNLLQLLLGKKKSSKDRFVEDYNKAVEKMIDGHQKNIKKKCKSDKIKRQAENGNTDQAKNNILDERKSMFKDILYMYNNWIRQSNKWCAEENETYMLVTDYLNYVSDYSTNYDDENPFVTELFDCIQEFIKTRMKMEKVETKSIRSNFNTKCKQLLSGKLGNIDYFNYFNSKFRTNWYVADDSNVISVADKDKKPDETYDSLYKKMYNHIMNVLQCNGVKRGTEELDTNVTSIDQFMSKIDMSEDFNESDKRIIELQNKAKSITKYFMMIRSITHSSSYAKGTYSLKDQTRYEAQKLRQIYNKALTAYYQDENLYEDSTLKHLFDEFTEVQCPYKGTIYINNISHEHYVYTGNTESMARANQYMEDWERDSPVSAKTQYEPWKLPYWLIYCAQATIINCMIPLYWGTGLNIMGVPILLPIIYLPIYYLPGSIGVLFGLGICGMAIWPMLVFINNTAYNGTMLIPINIVLDVIRKKLKDLGNASVASLKTLVQPFINECDDEIDKLQAEIEGINNTITKYKLKDSGADLNKVEGDEIKPKESGRESGRQRNKYSGAGTVNFDQSIDTTEYSIVESAPVDNTVDNTYYPSSRRTGGAAAVSYDSDYSSTYSKSVTNVTSAGTSTGSSSDVGDYSYNPNGRYHNILVCIDAAHNKFRTGKRTPWLCTKALPKGFKRPESWMELYEYKWSREVVPLIRDGLLKYGIDVYEITPQETEGDSKQDNLTKRKNRIKNKVKESGKNALYLSIHGNAAGNGDAWYGGKADGWSIYVSESRYKNDKMKRLSRELADCICDEAERILPNYQKRIRRGHGGTKYNTDKNEFGAISDSSIPIPCILSENLFYTHPDDCKFMASEEGKKIIAQIHINGVLKFIEKEKWT